MKTMLMTFLLAVTPLSAAIAQTCSKQSPAHTVALLELYTSEGCSSCPPADRTFGDLRASGAATGLGIDQLVPLAFHVDYWNDIGWKDVYSSRANTDRQQWLSNLANSRTIYTPEMFVAGKELRNWSGGIPAAVKRINTQPARADIGIVLGKPGTAGLPVEVSAHAAQGGNLYVALYENGIVSDVKAGENRGATLKHEYVVRQWIGPVALHDDTRTGKTAVQRSLPIPSDANARNLGVAAFVQGERGDVLQALALPLCGA